MKKFLIIPKCEFDDNDFSGVLLISAKNEKEAFELYAKEFACMDEMLKENVLSTSINMFFAERFWFQTKQEVSHFEQTGEVIIDEKEFTKRVYKYFGKHKKFAKDYLDYYLHGRDVNFSDEFYQYIFIKDYDELDYAIIDLSLIKQIG